MSYLIRSSVSAVLVVVVLAAGRAWAENEGQEDLDRATEAKLTANTLSDLAEVIGLCESALEKGLDKENAKFAENLLTSTLIQRGSLVAGTIFRSSSPDHRWPQFRHVALADLEKAVKLSPKHPRVLLSIARLNLLPGGDTKRAAEALDQAVEMLDDQPLIKAKALTFRSGLEKELDKKLAGLNEAVRLAPTDAAALRARSMVLANLKKPEQALADLDKAIELAPKHTATYLVKAMMLAWLKKYDQAVAAFSAVLAEEPENWGALRGRGDLLLNLGKHTEALADYEKVLKLRPKEPGVLNNLAWVLATSPTEEVRDGKRAVTLATEACELTDYKQAHILSTLAAAYAETGDFESAIKWTEKGLEVADEKQKEPLSKELESYRAGKPWRELLP